MVVVHVISSSDRDFQLMRVPFKYGHPSLYRRNRGSEDDEQLFLEFSHSDAHSWLSSVLTNHVICLDGLNGPARPIMEPTLKDLIARARASLAMVVAISPPPADEVVQPLNGRFPPWVTSRDRKLLEAPPKNIVSNVVVATDGSGNYTTVSEAVDSAPKKGETRYIIYVKAGTYNETVRIASGKTNLMLVGDGMNLTIITGSLNRVDGSTTFNSATVAVIHQESTHPGQRKWWLLVSYYHLFDGWYLFYSAIVLKCNKE
ncbi:hypothetical protein Vadar_029466 [Vaccinium darrowii]|nr:hypothetical protein Vadar_029466 [Vaccinium darrowii]